MMGKMTFKVILPLYLSVKRKTKLPKKYYMNLNGYRNWGYIVSNSLKSLYLEVVKEQILQLPKLDVITIDYYIYYPNKRLFDIDNIGSVTGKFFQDALTKLGAITDDNYQYIPSITYSFGGVDKDNPRIEAHIHTRGENEK